MSDYCSMVLNVMSLNVVQLWYGTLKALKRAAVIGTTIAAPQVALAVVLAAASLAAGVLIVVALTLFWGNEVPARRLERLLDRLRRIRSS